jgi:small-conductance mechanosensitive channel
MVSTVSALSGRIGRRVPSRVNAHLDGEGTTLNAIQETTTNASGTDGTGGGEATAVDIFNAINWDVALEVLAILLLAYVLAQLASTLLNEFANHLATARFRITGFIPIFKLVIYGTAVYLSFSLLFDLSENQLLALSGIIGAAIGFGLKDLVADVVGGLILVVERPYQIGDKVAIGEHYGEVVAIGLRSTSLVTPEDTRVTIPNYVFFNESIGNENVGNAEMLVTVDFYIDPASDARRAREIVEEALLTSPYVYVSEDLDHEVRLRDAVDKAAGYSEQVTFDVPADAKSGSSRMRIVHRNDDTRVTANPSGYTGETHDYTVEVADEHTNAAVWTFFDWDHDDAFDDAQRASTPPTPRRGRGPRTAR